MNTRHAYFLCRFLKVLHLIVIQKQERPSIHPTPGSVAIRNFTVGQSIFSSRLARHFTKRQEIPHNRFDENEKDESKRSALFKTTSNLIGYHSINLQTNEFAALLKSRIVPERAAIRSPVQGSLKPEPDRRSLGRCCQEK